MERMTVFENDQAIPYGLFSEEQSIYTNFSLAKAYKDLANMKGLLLTIATVTRFVENSFF
jgi:hypothetical protein